MQINKMFARIGFIFGVMVPLFFTGCRSNPSPTPTSIPTPTMVETEIVEVQMVPPWYRVYWEGKENAGSNMLILPDGGLLVVGSMEAGKKPKSIGGIMLFRTDKNGNSLWRKIYGGEGFDYGWDVTEALDGGYVIVGTTASFGDEERDGYVLKVDEGGELEWSKTFGGALNEGFYTLCTGPDGDYFIVGNVEDPKDFITDPGAAGYAGFAGRSNIYIVKLDKAGELIWSRVIESEQNVIAADGLVTEEGDFYVVATVNKYPEKGDDLLLYKFDQNGEQVWVRSWEEGDLGGYAIAKDEDGNMVMTGVSNTEDVYGSDLFVLKVDKDGNELFFEEFGDPNMFEIGHDITPLENGGYAILALQTPSLYVPMSFLFILVADPNGEILWESILEIDPSFSLIKGSAILQYPDGGFIITGSVVTKKDEFRTILIKTDPYGKIE